MTIWFEFPPDKLTTIRADYLAEGVLDSEHIQETPVLDATGTRMLVGSFRITSAKAGNLRTGRAWLVVHTTFPADWQRPADVVALQAR